MGEIAALSPRFAAREILHHRSFVKHSFRKVGSRREELAAAEGRRNFGQKVHLLNQRRLSYLVDSALPARQESAFSTYCEAGPYAREDREQEKENKTKVLQIRD